MKSSTMIITALLFFVMGFAANAQTTTQSVAATVKTESLKVSGNCDMCKSRIEKAAKLDGVSNAEWSTKSKILTVSYDPSKTNLDAIAKKIASVGHDNEKAKADAKVYDALPGCCKYDRSK